MTILWIVLAAIAVACFGWTLYGVLQDEDKERGR